MAASGTTRRASWQATPDPLAEPEVQTDGPDLASRPRPTETSRPSDIRPKRRRGLDERGGELDGETPSNGSNSGSPAKSRWRRVKLAPAKPADVPATY